MVSWTSSILCSAAALAVLLQTVAASYSSLGRYSRSLSWPPPLYYHRSARPLYYPDTDYYYPQDPYYYPSVYQSLVPGYYMDQQRPYYYGYDEVADPAEEVPEALPEDVERGEYGQETWYQDSNADANARFLQNLILAQMYGGFADQENSDRWVYGEPVDSARPKAKAKSSLAKEDEDVRELKSLVRGPERRDKGKKERENIFATQTRPRSNDWNEFRSNYKRSSSGTNNNHLEASSRKPKVASTPPPAPTPAATAPQTARGQKEVVLPRPSTARQTRGPREPSVYDTIKRLLHMEDELMEGDLSPSRLQKRSFVPSEESLVAQLGRLKKMA